MIQQDKEFVKYDSAFLSSYPDDKKFYIPTNPDSLTVKEIKEAKIRETRQIKKLEDSVDKAFFNLKYITFILLPFYAFYFWLLYRKKRPFYVDHLVYVMHFMTFAYCLFSVTLFLPLIPDITLKMMQRISVLIILVYVGLSVHYLYRQVWWKTIIKSLILWFALVVTTALAIMGTAVTDALFLK
jgi:hypothetical protein